jgi:GxxExxY protein
MATELIERELTHSVIGAFYEVYNALGYGFLESIYTTSLERELVVRGHAVSREHAVRVMYKGEHVGFQRLDMVVDGRLVVEIKSTPALAVAAERQLISYLRGTNLEVGLLLHFGPAPKFHRVVAPNRLAYPRHPDPSA